MAFYASPASKTSCPQKQACRQRSAILHGPGRAAFGRLPSGAKREADLEDGELPVPSNEASAGGISGSSESQL